MRRTISFLVVFALIAGACGGNDEGATTEPTTIASTTAAPTGSTTEPPNTLPPSSTVTTIAPTTSTSTTAPSTSTTTTTDPTTTTTLATWPVVELVAQPAGYCRDIKALGGSYSDAIAYWVAEGRPSRMDADRNGIPCETVYPASDVTAFFNPAVSATPAGRFCRDLKADGRPYWFAVAYWVTEDAPDRMDADRNGIPCETVYPASEIDAFYPEIPRATLAAFLEPFADFTAVPLRTTGTYPGPATPTSLSSVQVPAALADALDAPAVRAKLEANGFVVVPADYRLMHQPYEWPAYSDVPTYVTTDAAYHYWHLAFSKVLRETEARVLLPALEDLARGLVADARTQRAELAGTTLADSADRVVQFFEALATLLELDVGPIGTLAQAEVALALEHTKTTTSPTIGTSPCDINTGHGCVHYALFKPRGHYTRSAELERFFRAMSLLGNAGFSVRTGPGLNSPIDTEAVRRAVLAARVLHGDAALLDRWELIYEPTAFMVGSADDYTPRDLAAAAGAFNPATRFGADATVRRIGEALLAQRDVKINEENTTVRIMGSRFVIDSFVFDRLPLEFTSDDKPVASALDIAAVFGSETALNIRRLAPGAAVAGLTAKTRELRSMIDDRSIDNWAATVYDAWLYALEAVWASHGAPYPDYMRRDAWAAKDLQTGLGSYTELKHDTILYAKQRLAEGEGPPWTDQRHWVEPDPVVYRRLAAVTGMFQQGMRARDLLELDDPRDYILTKVGSFLLRLAGIADDELAGRPLTNEDREYLSTIGSTMEWLWLISADQPEAGEPILGQDANSALIADIDTSMNGALEVATGRVDTIYVIVPDNDGGFHVAVGGVYSFYEFFQPASNRLNDLEWHAMLDNGTAPDRPTWQRVFLAD